MCYSKEVQLVTALIIIVSALFYYSFYSRKYSEKWLKLFLNNILLAFVCVGIHQFFEFLSLVTENQIIYKTGLIISIFSVYFALRSLEVLVNHNYYSKYFLVLIGGVFIHMLFFPLSFEEQSFYLRHHSAFIWAGCYLLGFLYWNICAFKARSELKDNDSRKTIILYLLFTFDISFILSAIYVLIGHFRFSVNVCTDSPSIWCTFFVVQSLLIPVFLSFLPTAFKRPEKKSSSLRTAIICLLISAVIFIILLLTLPYFKCFTWKLAFP